MVKVDASPLGPLPAAQSAATGLSSASDAIVRVEELSRDVVDDHDDSTLSATPSDGLDRKEQGSLSGQGVNPGGARSSSTLRRSAGSSSIDTRAEQARHGSGRHGVRQKSLDNQTESGVRMTEEQKLAFHPSVEVATRGAKILEKFTTDDA